MCFWSEIALFNCDGTVQRQKHLCRLVPNDGLRAGVEICKDYETPLGCKHSETARPIPRRAMYRHVCDKDAYKTPAGSGMRPKWTPAIKAAFPLVVTNSDKNSGQLKDSVQFKWCDGSVCTLEEVFGDDAPRFCWGGVDLLRLTEGEVVEMVGKGAYQHWVGVWSGEAEAEAEAEK
jgi:hypothetical protein